MDINYNDIYLTIEDFEVMKDFLSKFWGGEYDNKVIRVKGINSTRISHCAVMISDGGSLRLGCSWEVEGGTYPDDYPFEGARIELTGVLRVKGEYGVRVLEVPSENVKTL